MGKPDSCLAIASECAPLLVQSCSINAQPGQGGAHHDINCVTSDFNTQKNTACLKMGTVLCNMPHFGDEIPICPLGRSLGEPAGGPPTQEWPRGRKPTKRGTEPRRGLLPRGRCRLPTTREQRKARTMNRRESGWTAMRIKEETASRGRPMYRSGWSGPYFVKASKRRATRNVAG